MKLSPADRYFSQWIRLRDKACRRCGSRVKFNYKGLPITHQASHFKGRAKQGTRFEPMNVDTMCGGCHRYLTAQPDEHVEWQVKTKGQKMVDQIILQANTYHKKQYEIEKVYWKDRIYKDYGIKV